VPEQKLLPGPSGFAAGRPLRVAFDVDAATPAEAVEAQDGLLAHDWEVRRVEDPLDSDSASFEEEPDSVELEDSPEEDPLDPEDPPEDEDSPEVEDSPEDEDSPEVEDEPASPVEEPLALFDASCSEARLLAAALAADALLAAERRSALATSPGSCPEASCT
jgi:hypothetical protein